MTRYAPMVVHWTFVIPIPVPGSQSLTTTLRNFSTWIDHGGDVLGELLEPPILPVVTSQNVLFHTRLGKSYIAGIFFWFAEYCKVVVWFDYVKFFHLTDVFSLEC